MARREVQAGSVFRRVLPPIPPAVGRPGVTGAAVQRDVPIRSLAASQRRLDPERVQHYVDNPSDEPVTVLHTKQFGHIIFDGHHRAAAAKRSGQKTVRADVREW